MARQCDVCAKSASFGNSIEIRGKAKYIGRRWYQNHGHHSSQIPTQLAISESAASERRTQVVASLRTVHP